MLLHMLILLAFAKMQDFAEDSYAWQWALAFAVVTFLFGLFGGPPDCGSYFRCDLGPIFMGLFRPAAADGRQFDFVADGMHRRDYAAVAAADEAAG